MNVDYRGKVRFRVEGWSRDEVQSHDENRSRDEVRFRVEEWLRDEAQLRRFYRDKKLGACGLAVVDQKYHHYRCQGDKYRALFGRK